MEQLRTYLKEVERRVLEPSLREKPEESLIKLYLNAGATIKESLEKGTELSSKIIQKIGARI